MMHRNMRAIGSRRSLPRPTGGDKLCAALRKSQSEAAILEIKDRDHISIIRKMSHENDPATQALIEFVRKHAGLTSAETDTKKETNNKTGEGAPGKR